MRAKVIDNAKALGLDVNVRHLPGAAGSPADTAAAIGCGASRVARSAVYVADGDPVVCMLAGGCPIDLDALADTLDVAELRPATASEVRAATGYPAGGVAPFGHGLPVVVDSALMGHRTVWSTGGDGNTLVELEPARLVSCTSATVAAVTRQAS